MAEITGETMISTLIEDYPQVVDFLVYEYGFFCVSCFLAGYEKFEEGAKVHGIEGENFEEMLENIDKLIRGELDYLSFTPGS